MSELRAAFEAMSGDLYWAHDGDCPLRYNVNLPDPCTCGVAAAQDALNAALFSEPASTGLDEAWREAETALPEDGQHFTLVRHGAGDYCVTATVEPFTADGRERGYDVLEGDGTTLAAALRALSESVPPQDPA